VKTIVLGTLAIIVALLFTCIAYFTPLDAKAQGYKFIKGVTEVLPHGLEIEMTGSELRVLILADTHYGTGTTNIRQIDSLVKSMVKNTNPDMIVLLGDNVCNFNAHTRLQHVIRLMDSFAIPWSPVFGNHDAEGRATKRYLARMIADKSQFAIFDYGPNNFGKDVAGNYFVNVKNEGQAVHTLYFLDSATQTKTIRYPKMPLGILDLYEAAVIENDYLPSTMFSHYPIQEYSLDRIFRAIPENIGLFDLMHRLGSTRQMFAGHVHGRGTTIEHEGIKLSYATTSRLRGLGITENSLVGGTLLTVLDDGQTSYRRVSYK